MPLRQGFAFLILCLIINANNLFAQQLSPKLMLPIGSREALLDARFSPDGKKIVTASADKTAMVWDAATGNLLLVLSGHRGNVLAAEFSPDGKKILTASDDNTIKVWNAETGTEMSLLRHRGPVLSAHFSENGKKILSASADGIVRIWNVVTEKIAADLAGANGKAYAAEFSPGEKNIVAGYADGTVRLWDGRSNKGKVFIDASGNDAEHRAAVISVQFSPDGNMILTASEDSTAKIWDVKSGELLKTLAQHTDKLISAKFSPDGSKVVTASIDKKIKIWDVDEGTVLRTLAGHTNSIKSVQFTLNGKKIISTSLDSSIRIWDAGSGHPDRVIKKHKGKVWSAALSKDSTRFVSASYDGTAKVWDLETGLMLSDLKGHTSWVYSASFSPDGKKIVTATDDSTIKVWDAINGGLLANLKGHRELVYSATFSPDGKKIISTSKDRTIKVWDANSGSLALDLLSDDNSGIIYTDHSPDGSKIILTSSNGNVRIIDALSGNQIPLSIMGRGLKAAKFSPGGQKIIAVSSDSTAKVWDAASGDLLYTLAGHEAEVLFAGYSPDNTRIVTISADQNLIRWDTSGRAIDTITLEDNLININSASFSPDSKNILTASDDKMARVWELESGKPLLTLKGHADLVNTARFDPSGKKIITASGDNTIKIWNAMSGKLLYTFFAVDSSDYLVIDPYNHFDGTQNARDLLYFICGSEFVSLDQVKGDLWIPNLAEDINNGNPIRARSLDELDVCGLIPEVEAAIDNGNEFQFLINPRRGGLGEIVLFVNGIEAKRYKKEELRSFDGGYEVNIQKDSLAGYFISGEENWVSLKAYTRDNDISSPEAKISVDRDSSAANVIPNLYAVVIGTSTYKENPQRGESGFDTNINLAYPAIDARAVSQTLSEAARKMLNTDGKEHVFLYKLTTDSSSVLKPDKQTIKMVLDSIGKKATANDILLIFMSGHGVMDEENGKNRFYYMTADASSLQDEKSYPRVGISTEELTEWIRPKNIRAQKRILILDACNSGQAINDLFANSVQQVRTASRRDDQSGLIKDIDRLNERSGLFILSASASNKSAFESEKYSHGYLTYSLLRVIKEQPDILEEGNKLNISRWFNSAGKSVSEMAREDNNYQKTQIFSVTDFNVGEVDSAVMATIAIKGMRPLFTASNFILADTVGSGDELGLSQIVNNSFREVSLKGKESPIVFAMSSLANDTYSLGGAYTIVNNEVRATFCIKKGRERICEFEERGTPANLKELAVSMVAKAIDWVVANK